jgi:hypothetical protein
MEKKIFRAADFCSRHSLKDLRCSSPSSSSRRAGIMKLTIRLTVTTFSST